MLLNARGSDHAPVYAGLNVLAATRNILDREEPDYKS